jgi:hypothetical protein
VKGGTFLKEIYMNLVNVRSSLYGETNQVKDIFRQMDILDFNAIPKPYEELRHGQTRCVLHDEAEEIKDLIPDYYFSSAGFFIEGEESNKSFGSSLFQVINEDDLSQMVGNSLNQSYSTLFEVIDEDDSVRFLGVVPNVGLLPLGDFEMESSDMKSVVNKVISDFIEYSSIQTVN